jgi:predicted CXXCH cytochrome family protein
MHRSLRKSRSRHPLYVLIACVVAGALWQGCTVTRDNYTTLSYFFDGVPDPNGKFATVDVKTGQVNPLGKFSQHKPFVEEKCADCHSGVAVLSKNSSEICMKCHAAVPTQHRYTHGPVAASACLWCHSPHDAPRPHLLREDDRKLCTQCHAPGALDAEREPAHADESRACLECHYGHGGDRRFLLRHPAGFSPPAPGSIPSTEPSAAPEKGSR